MRRLASEIIRNLEMRVARLERKGSSLSKAISDFERSVKRRSGDHSFEVEVRQNQLLGSINGDDFDKYDLEPEFEWFKSQVEDAGYKVTDSWMDEDGSLIEFEIDYIKV
jgi:hypothetical protein